MTRETFGRGIQMLNSVIPQNKNIVDEKLDVYYLILKDYSDEDYLSGIQDMLRNHKLEYGAPSPATIIEYIEKNSQDLVGEEIFRRIKMDILLLGADKLSYDEGIRKAIDSIGGIQEFVMKDESEVKDKFIKAYRVESTLLENRKAVGYKKGMENGN